MRNDDEDLSSCIEVIPSPFGDGETNQDRREREEGSPDTTITTSSSYLATRHLGTKNYSLRVFSRQNLRSFYDNKVGV